MIPIRGLMKPTQKIPKPKTPGKRVENMPEKCLIPKKYAVNPNLPELHHGRIEMKMWWYRSLLIKGVNVS